MIEYRTERVNPNYEDSVVSTLAMFGWVNVSSQEIYNESTEIVGMDVKTYGSFMQGFTGKDGTINIRQRKNVTNYVILKFARDTSMPNYDRLKTLNNQYESKMNVPEPRKPIIRTAVTVIGVIIILISFLMAIPNGTAAEVWEIIFSVAFPIVMIPITIVSWLIYKRKMREYSCVIAQLIDICNEAEKLMVSDEI